MYLILLRTSVSICNHGMVTDGQLMHGKPLYTYNIRIQYNKHKYLYKLGICTIYGYVICIQNQIPRFRIGKPKYILHSLSKCYHKANGFFNGF